MDHNGSDCCFEELLCSRLYRNQGQLSVPLTSILRERPAGGREVVEVGKEILVQVQHLGEHPFFGHVPHAREAVYHLRIPHEVQVVVIGYRPS